MTRACAIVVMALVTTLHSRRFQEIDEGEAHHARAAVRHARDPAGVCRDAPRSLQEASSDGTPPCGGLGLADADPVERADGVPALTTEARVWPCRSRRGSANHERGEAGGDQFWVAHEDEPLQSG